MTIKNLRIIFAGTPDFAVPALAALHAAGADIAAVYTQPDRPAGRGRKPGVSPVKKKALELGIPVEQPETLKVPEVQAGLAALDADCMIVAAYGLLLPQTVLDMPRFGCINIHASLLPRWRGAAPIQRAIAAGDTKSGVSIMQMAAGLDTGAVWLSRECAIDDDTTGGSLHDQLAALGSQALLQALPEITAQRRQPVEQDARLATYASKLDKREAKIDWHQCAAVLDRQIRAFNPWPVMQTSLDDAVVRIWQASVVEAAGRGSPGEVLNTTDGLDVATGNGVLRLLKVQLAGRKPVTTKDFLNSRRLTPGVRFG